jgi:5-methylcytosine-specific restriction protein A
MPLKDITKPAVMSAIAECDHVGHDEFLALYGFRPARRYVLELNGQRYDSKAIAGVAHKYIAPGGKPLGADEFSGGDATVAAKLRDLGFTVTDMGPLEIRNSPWTRDELILALDLYLRNRESPPGKASPEVADLSALLHLLGERLGRATEDRYRNTNGVYMKMMNFRRFDPESAAEGRVGLTRGNKLEESVWNEFANDRPRLREVAAAIMSALRDDREWQDEQAEDDNFEAPEGRVLTRVHMSRERNRALVEKKKAAAIAQTGRLACEVCSFDFGVRYAERGRGFIEVHHLRPLHTLEDGHKTKLGDLALVCANCHRMIHSSRPWLSIQELRSLLRNE